VDDRPVLILGAGINGASVARELALNGVPVWVVDDGDIASGATSKSSRLIHGGVRYLEYGDVRLVREALAERERLLHLAPQFVRPLRFALPVGRRLGGWLSAVPRFFGWQRRSSGPRGMWLMRTGLWMYDRLATGSSLPRHRVRRVGEPGLPRVDAGAYDWLCMYSDAQMWFPERYTLALLRDAAEASRAEGLDFRVLTYQTVARRGGLFEVSPGRDATPLRIEPPVVVNASGAWGDSTLRGISAESQQLFGGTKGSHFLTSYQGLRDALGDCAVYAESQDGRFVFILPHEDHVLIGTTDLPVDGNPREAVATPEELDYLLALVLEVFPDVPLTREDIHCHYCGVRPLPHSNAGTPAAVTRDHRIDVLAGDLPVLTLIGGKLTTSRRLGEQTADWILERLKRERKRSTRDRIVPGGENYPADASDLDERIRQLAGSASASESDVRRMWQLLGSRAADVCNELAAAAPSAGRPLPRIGPFPREFVRWVIRHEWVCRPEDLIARRLMLVLADSLSADVVRQLIELMVEEGVIGADAVDAVYAETVTGLRRHFGCRGL